MKGAFFLEIIVDVTSKNNHDQGNGHATKERKNREESIGNHRVGSCDFKSNGQYRREEDRVEDTFPLKGRFLLSFKEQMGGTEKEGSIKHGEKEEKRGIEGTDPKHSCENSQREEDTILIKETDGKFPSLLFAGDKHEQSREASGDEGEEKPPDRKLPPRGIVYWLELLDDVDEDKAGQGDIKGKG